MNTRPDLIIVLAFFLQTSYEASGKLSNLEKISIVPEQETKAHIYDRIGARGFNSKQSICTYWIASHWERLVPTLRARVAVTDLKLLYQVFNTLVSWFTSIRRL